MTDIPKDIVILQIREWFDEHFVPCDCRRYGGEHLHSRPDVLQAYNQFSSLYPHAVENAEQFEEFALTCPTISATVSSNHFNIIPRGQQLIDPSSNKSYDAIEMNKAILVMNKKDKEDGIAMFHSKTQDLKAEGKNRVKNFTTAERQQTNACVQQWLLNTGPKGVPSTTLKKAKKAQQHRGVNMEEEFNVSSVNDDWGPPSTNNLPSYAIRDTSPLAAFPPKCPFACCNAIFKDGVAHLESHISSLACMRFRDKSILIEDNLVSENAGERQFFACPQCFRVFVNLDDCENHQKALEHFKLAFPILEGDIEDLNKGVLAPPIILSYKIFKWLVAVSNDDDQAQYICIECGDSFNRQTDRDFIDHLKRCPSASFVRIMDEEHRIDLMTIFYEPPWLCTFCGLGLALSERKSHPAICKKSNHPNVPVTLGQSRLIDMVLSQACFLEESRRNSGDIGIKDDVSLTAEVVASTDIPDLDVSVIEIPRPVTNIDVIEICDDD